MKKLFESIFREAGYDTFTNSLGEKDTYWNPNKAEPREYDYGQDFDWQIRQPVKGEKASSKEHLEGEELAKELRRAFSEYDYHTNNEYKFTVEARLSHDYDSVKQYKRKIATITNNFDALIRRAIEIDFDPYDYKDDILKGCYSLIEKHINWERDSLKKSAASEKRKATRDINIKNKALETDIQELKDLLDENGDLKEKRSYGTIKKYLDTPDGKNFLALWKKQFRNK